jgi:amino acid transporter
MSEAKLSRKISLLQASCHQYDRYGWHRAFCGNEFCGAKNEWWVFLICVDSRRHIISSLMAWFGASLEQHFHWQEGSYNFLKEGFGEKWGKPMSFLFVWQTMIQAPLVIASCSDWLCAIFNYIAALNEVESKIVSGAVVVLIIFLLYRNIETYW